MTLVPTLLDPSSRERTCVAPPPNFRPLGNVLYTRIGTTMFCPGVGRTVAQRNGQRFEAKVQRYLQKQFPTYIQWPRLEVMDERYVLRSLVPDGLFVYDDLATVVEIKSQHMPESWWQLHELYGPAVRKLPLVLKVNLLTIVKSYDPAMPYPGPIQRLDRSDLEIFLANEATKIGVLVWRS